MVEINQRQYAETEQKAQKWELVRQKQEEEDELDSAIESKKQVLKQLVAQRNQIRQEKRSLINQTTATAQAACQLRFPFGVSDSPLTALGVAKAKRGQLEAVGIERIPQLVDLVEGKNEKFPKGLASIEGLKPASAKQILDALQAYLERDPQAGKSKATEAPPKKNEEEEEVFPHKAKLLTDVAKSEGYDLGKVIDGVFNENDNSFSCKDYVFNQGEFELIPSA